MYKYLVILAALSALIGGCGKSEEPNTTPAMHKPADPAMQSNHAAETTMVAPPMAEAPTPMAEAMPLATEAPMPMQEMPSDGAAPMGEMATAQPAADKGKQIYDSVCFACHAMGVAGAPKFGDKELWAPRIAQGMDTLVSHAINGFQGKTGAMPPKGGRVDLSDADIAAAVAYMVGQAK